MASKITTESAKELLMQPLWAAAICATSTLLGVVTTKLFNFRLGLIVWVVAAVAVTAGLLVSDIPDSISSFYQPFFRSQLRPVLPGASPGARNKDTFQVF